MVGRLVGTGDGSRVGPIDGTGEGDKLGLRVGLVWTLVRAFQKSEKPDHLYALAESMSVSVFVAGFGTLLGSLLGTHNRRHNARRVRSRVPDDLKHVGN